MEQLNINDLVAFAASSRCCLPRRLVGQRAIQEPSIPTANAWDSLNPWENRTYTSVTYSSTQSGSAISHPPLPLAGRWVQPSSIILQPSLQPTVPPNLAPPACIPSCTSPDASSIITYPLPAKKKSTHRLSRPSPSTPPYPASTLSPAQPSPCPCPSRQPTGAPSPEH